MHVNSVSGEKLHEFEIIICPARIHPRRPSTHTHTAYRSVCIVETQGLKYTENEHCISYGLRVINSSAGKS